MATLSKTWKTRNQLGFLKKSEFFFLLLVCNGAILTKDNSVKRNWKGDPYMLLL
jgi:hypothetical protein